MTRHLGSAPGWSDEAMSHFAMKGRDIVRPVIYDGQNLLASVQLRMIAAKKAEMRGHIERLAALPFQDLDDREFLQINSRTAKGDKSLEGHEGDPSNLAMYEEIWGAETDGSSGGWGSWTPDSDTSLTSDAEDHFSDPDSSLENPFNTWGDEFADKSPVESTTDCGEWGNPEEHYEHSMDFDAIVRRSKWKFPTAFKRSEKTVPHTDEEMGYYVEAADFLVNQANRHRNQRLERQGKAFRNMTRIPYPKKGSNDETAAIDWDFVTKELDERMAQRKKHQKSKLQQEVPSDSMNTDPKVEKSGAVDQASNGYTGFPLRVGKL